MPKPLNLEGFEGQNIEVEPAGFLTPAKLLVNGQPAPRGKRPNENRLTRNDGREVIVTWKPQLLDMPLLVVDGKTIPIVRPLKFYEWAWSVVPVGLVFTGKPFVGLLGLVAFSINVNILRSERSTPLKYGLTLLITLLAGLIYYVFPQL